MTHIIDILRAHLGLELEEAFTLIPRPGEPFKILLRFTEHHLQSYADKIGWITSDVDINTFAHGVIKKQPYKPHKNQSYWSYNELFIPTSYIWTDNINDYLRLKADIVYRTEDEALANLREKYQQITGKERGKEK